MNILGFVPARGGSIGIRNKNLVKINGKPLIKYTLDIVKKLKKDVKPFISSDNKDILNYCKKNGFTTDYIRPKKLSNPKSNVVDAVLDAVEWLKKNKKYNTHAVLILQPTTPLRYLEEIKRAIKSFKSKKITSIASVTPMREHPYECVEKIKKSWKFIKQPPKNTFQRQQFDKIFYFIDGTFYLAKINFLKKYKTFVKKNNTQLVFLKRTWPIDIDVKDDLIVASALMELVKK